MLKIFGIHDRGEYSRERIVFIVTAGCNLGEYSAACADRDANAGLDGPAFYFPSFDVREGDIVRLFTRPRMPNELVSLHYSPVTPFERTPGEPRKNAVHHHLFWGLAFPLWANDLDAVELRCSRALPSRNDAFDSAAFRP